MPKPSDESYISEMLLRVTTRPDAGLVAAATRRTLHRELLITRAAGWTAVCLALLLDGSRPLLVAGVLLGFAVPVLLVNLGVRRTLRAGGPTTYEISDGGVASSSRESRHAYAWDAFGYVEKTPGQLLFGGGKARLVPVPTSGLSPMQVEQVLGAAAGHGLRVRRA